MTPIIQHITPIVNHYVTGNARAVVFGGGLAFALSNGYWHHTPLVLLNPFAYASYQVFVGQKQIIDWYKQTLNELR